MPASAGLHRESFGLGSPALGPVDSGKQRESALESPEEKRIGSAGKTRSEHELDREATAALLMLNHDRRSWGAFKSGDKGRGAAMSVRDLLSG